MWLAALMLAASVPGSVKAAAPPVGRPIVIGASFDLVSQRLGGTRRINVYLPDDYAADAKRSFPVLFLLDGGEHEDFLHIAGLAQITAAYGEGQEMVVVGIAGVDRRHDLTSPSTVPADLKVAPTSGGAAAYRTFLVDELKPWVAEHYRTSGRSALIGESLAGLFVLESALKAPGGFSDFIAVSPSLWWNHGALAAGAAHDLVAHRHRDQRLFVAFETPPPPPEQAAKDRARQDQLAATLRSARPAGLSVTIVRMSEGHGDIYHPAALRALRTLFAIPAAKR